VKIHLISLAVTDSNSEGGRNLKKKGNSRLGALKAWRNPLSIGPETCSELKLKLPDFERKQGSDC